MPVIPALGRLRKEDSEFKVSLDFIARLVLSLSPPLPFKKGIHEFKS
jgi:hypothetical protein